jgi:GxxExxY protein
MDTDKHESELLHRELVYAVVGSAMEVLNTLGHGLHEKPYENALCIEFGLRQIAFAQQRRYEVHYKGSMVGEFVPDLIVADKVVVDAKVIERITDIERGQMINYLRITKLRVGLVLNFKRPTLEWERLIL